MLLKKSGKVEIEIDKTLFAGGSMCIARSNSILIALRNKCTNQLFKRILLQQFFVSNTYVLNNDTAIIYK